VWGSLRASPFFFSSPSSFFFLPSVILGHPASEDYRKREDTVLAFSTVFTNFSYCHPPFSSLLYPSISRNSIAFLAGYFYRRPFR